MLLDFPSPRKLLIDTYLAVDEYTVSADLFTYQYEPEEV